jgi:signal peptidase
MFGKAIRWAAGVTLVSVSVVMLGVLVAPRLFGWTSYLVTSGSMSPTFDAGAVVVAAPVDPESLKVGDIVTYDISSGTTTHRIVERRVAHNPDATELAFTTRGDANEEADPSTLDPRNVVGKAKFAVPTLGYVVSIVRTPVGAGVIALLLVAFLLGGRRGDEEVGSSPGPAMAATS